MEMSNFFAASLLISIVISLSLIFVLLKNRARDGEWNELLVRFNQIAVENKLIFSHQEIIKPAVIGLDLENKKLLFVKRINKEKYKTALVDLDELRSAGVRRIKHSAATNEKHWLKGFLEKIVLQLEFTGNKPSIRLPFYTYWDNHIFEIQQLESRAKDWEARLSRMVADKYQKAAFVAQPLT